MTKMGKIGKKTMKEKHLEFNQRYILCLLVCQMKWELPWELLFTREDRGTKDGVSVCEDTPLKNTEQKVGELSVT